MTEPAVITIKTPHLILRELRASDAAELCRIVTIPQVGRMLFLFPPDWTVEAARVFIGKVGFGGTPNGRLAVTDADGRFIGSVGVATRDSATEVFYFLAPEVAGQGYATEAMGAFLGWLTDRFGPREITAYVFQDNPASARVLEKLGFQCVGEAMGTSAARLEPFPDWVYRLSLPNEKGQEG